MSDLTDKESALAVKVVGAATSDGTEQTPVQSTSAGGLHINLRDSAGTEVGTSANPVRVDLPSDATSSTINITTQDISSASIVGYAGQVFYLGNPTANSAASFSLNSVQTIMIIIKGIWTGTLSIETSSDGGTTWVQRGIHIVGTALFAGSVTSNVIGSLNAAAKTNVRVRAIAAMTGTVNVTTVTSDNPSNVYVANSVKIVDGSGTNSTAQMAVKPASTAALATDTSVVVALNPGTAINLPTGAATAANQASELSALQIIDDVPSAQNAAFVKGTPIMGQLDDVSTTAATEDNVAAARITAQRGLHANLRNNAGTEVGTNAAPIVVHLGDGTDLHSVSSNGDAKVVDGVRNGGVYGALSSTTANVAIEAKVGVARLASRKVLQITILSTGVYWGLDNTVTVSSGTPLANNQVLAFTIDPDSTFQVWLVSASTNRNYRIIELP